MPSLFSRWLPRRDMGDTERERSVESDWAKQVL